VKRTGLHRTTGLERGTHLARKAELTRTPDLSRSPWSPAVPLLGKSAPTRKGRAAGAATGQPKPPGEFTDAVKLLIRKRAGRGDVFDACCESCGVWLGEKGGEYSHRDARGMGGSRDPVVNGPAGGTLACGSGALRTGCHGRCENRDRHMNEMGFWLENGQDPLAEPIMLHGAGGSGVTLWLAADGLGPDGTGYLLQAPEGLVA
jgi:hypothetical protein